MKRISVGLLLLFLTQGVYAQVDWGSKEVVEVPLKLQVLSPMPVVTPRPDYRDTTGQPDGRCFADIPSKTEGGIPLDAVSKTEVKVDTDGDGTPDTAVGADKPVVVLSPLGGESTRTYAVSFIRDTACAQGKKYRFIRQGGMVGKFNGQNVLVIDENSNGIYGEVGKDACAFGATDGAHWLSTVVLVKKELFYFKVNQEGTKAFFLPYTGETGELSLSSKFRVGGKLMLGMVSQGEMCFDAATAKKIDVPVGTYTFAGGAVGMNIKMFCRIQPGTMKPFDVTAKESFALEWGTPGKIDFTKTLAGGKLTISPNIKYSGLAGEIYTGFVPKDPLPMVEVFEEAGGKPRKKFASSRMPCG